MFRPAACSRVRTVGAKALNVFHPEFNVREKLPFGLPEHKCLEIRGTPKSEYKSASHQGFFAPRFAGLRLPLLRDRLSAASCNW